MYIIISTINLVQYNSSELQNARPVPKDKITDPHDYKLVFLVTPLKTLTITLKTINFIIKL